MKQILYKLEHCNLGEEVDSDVARKTSLQMHSCLREREREAQTAKQDPVQREREREKVF